MFHTALALLLLVAQTVSAADAGKYADVDGSKIWYEECGVGTSRPTVVLLHDGLIHSVTWDGVWQPLCSKYHVIRYDRRGYGRSAPAKSPFVPEKDLSILLHQLHVDKAVIVGNSSGGGMAIDFALAYPRMVTALLLIDPVVHGMATSDYFNARGSENNAPLAHGDIKATARNWSQDRFLIAGDDPAARKKLLDALVSSPQDLNVANGFEIRPSPPSAGRLSEINVPTLILVGDADIGDVFAYSGAIEAAVPLASLEIWKDAGHMIQVQRPAEIVSRLDRFMALVSRKEVNLPESTLAQYVGRYKLFNRGAAVFLKNGRLIMEIPGDPYYRLFAASPAKFFLRTDETEIIFDKTGMTITNPDGSTVHAARETAPND